MHSFPPYIDIFITKDGSPTLAFRREDGYVEKMHHSAGALGESCYIYLGALEELLQRQWIPRILSFGLGLGYNEMLTLARLTPLNLPDWKMWSFESDPFLYEAFGTWLVEKDLGEAVYDNVLKRVAERMECSPLELKNEMRTAWEIGKWEIRRAFPDDATGTEEITLVYYDAYSNKMNPELWQEDPLVQHFSPRLAKNCVFSTYAATGALRRSLKALGFQMLPKRGYEGKRESTLAIRTENFVGQAAFPANGS